MKTEFCSDNSVSLPGIIPGSSGPVGFEPGMFKNEDENSSHSHTKSKSDKDKSIDGQSKVSSIFIRRERGNLTLQFHMFLIRKRKRKTRSGTSTRNIVITKIRKSAKRGTNARRAETARRAENEKRAKRRRIRIFRDCRCKRRHRKH